MNIYVVVEGEISEKIVYASWIPMVNSSLIEVETIDEVKSNNFLIFSGGGYPQYLEMIDNSIEDVNRNVAFDRLVVSVDSEDMSFNDKLNEISDHTSKQACRVSIEIIVQHFCLEAWALGNRRIIRPSPRSEALMEYKGVFNVRDQDPELLPNYPPRDWNRAQFAEAYLRTALNERFRNVTYRKNQPDVLLHPTYFQELKKRLEDTGHIGSFGKFLTAFA